jgi:hypothetical protein
LWVVFIVCQTINILFILSISVSFVFISKFEETVMSSHTPRTIGQSCGVSERWARVLCRRVIGRRKFYRLTDEENAKVVAEYLKWRREESEESGKVDSKRTS